MAKVIKATGKTEENKAKVLKAITALYDGKVVACDTDKFKLMPNGEFARYYKTSVNDKPVGYTWCVCHLSLSAFIFYVESSDIKILVPKAK